jgi:hypothetical protein
LPEDVKELVLRLITSLPVSQFLKVSQLQAESGRQMLIAYLEAQPVVVYA